MNHALTQLQPYPFEKLRALLGSVKPAADKRAIALSIGEPKHESPAFVAQAMADNLDKLAVYPSTIGLPGLRQAIGQWCERRFGVPAGWLDADRHILPVNGTREALFAFTQAVVNRADDGLVISPNPFYQIYEGAALLAGATPHYLPCLENNGFNPDFDAVPAEVWKRCQILFLCSPGNPTGALVPMDTLKKLIALADEHDFVIAADECYSELYFDEDAPPPGLLTACAELGRSDFKRCVVFHSLSKRSNLPGLRSGFVAGDARSSNRSCCTAPTTAAPCRYKPSWPASPPGRMRRMYARTATSTAPSTMTCWTSCSRCWTCSARTAASTCGPRCRAVMPSSPATCSKPSM